MTAEQRQAAVQASTLAAAIKQRGRVHEKPWAQMPEGMRRNLMLTMARQAEAAATARQAPEPAQQQDKGGTSNARFSSSQTQRVRYTEQQRAQILQGPPVTVLRGDEAPREGFARLTRWATELFEKIWDGKVTNPEIGEVLLNDRSVRDSIAHSCSPVSAPPRKTSW